MQVETDRMIPVARLQKELTGKLRELTDNGEPLYVMRNNSLPAVIVSPEEYDLLKNDGELMEHLELEVIEIIGIGKREKEEIYKLIVKRLKKLG